MKQRLERALRTIAAMPDDDWQPHHFDEFFAAQTVVRDELDWHDRHRERQAEAKRRRSGERAARELVKHPGWFTEAEGKRVVRNRAGGCCEFVGSDGVRCSFRHEQVHHMLGRLGDDPHHPSKLAALCGAHHDWCHLNPEAARELGFMKSRLAVNQ